MLKNNKRTPINRNRWSNIIDFLISNELDMKSMVYSACCPEMMRVDFILENAAMGDLKISTRTILPEGGNNVVLGSFVRPMVVTPDRLKQRIDSITTAETMYFVANQIELFP